MKKILCFFISLVFASGLYSAQNNHIKSYTKRDKALKLDELFLDPTNENESVFDDSPKIVAPIVSKKLIFDEILTEEAPNPTKVKSDKLAKLLGCAYELMGTRYSFGAAKGSAKTDCSLYTQNVFKQVGITLPRSSAEQSNLGETIAKSDLQIGDLLFFRTYKREPSHVGIYVGDNKMIHASFRKGEVLVDDITKAYYNKRYLFAKRHSL